MNELREELAASEHERWSRWMVWMFANMTEKNITRWKRQMVTPYGELEEYEKNSDRKEADRTIAIIKTHLTHGKLREAKEEKPAEESTEKEFPGKTPRCRTEAEIRFVEEHGDKEIEVCSDCEMACCWQGVLMCDTAYEAGTKMITVEEAAELALEHFDYWKADLDQQRENAPEPKVHHKRAFKAKKAEAGKGEIRCSFCGKTREEVKKLVRPEGKKETICNECVSLCVELMGEEDRTSGATTEEKIENLAEAIAGGQARHANLEERVAKLEETTEKPTE